MGDGRLGGARHGMSMGGDSCLCCAYRKPPGSSWKESEKKYSTVRDREKDLLEHDR